jgi:hypothetical protein
VQQLLGDIYSGLWVFIEGILDYIGLVFPQFEVKLAAIHLRTFLLLRERHFFRPCKVAYINLVLSVLPSFFLPQSPQFAVSCTRDFPQQFAKPTVKMVLARTEPVDGCDLVSGWIGVVKIEI